MGVCVSWEWHYLHCDCRYESVMFHLVEAGILDHGCEPRMGFRISSETPASKMQPQPCSAAALKKITGINACENRVSAVLSLLEPRNCL